MATWMVTHKATWHNQQIRNVYYYDEISAAPTTSEWQDIVDEIRADYIAELQAQLVTEYEFWGIDYRLVSTAGLLSLQALPTAGAVVGTETDDSVATQVALLVSVKGATVKPNRARTYLCGFAETSLTNSLWGSGLIGFCEDFIDLQSVLNSAGTNELQRVAAQWNSGHTQVIDSNFISASASVGSVVPATQCRRRIGVGI